MTNDQATHSEVFPAGKEGGVKWSSLAVLAGILAILALLPAVVDSPLLLDILCVTFVTCIGSVSLRTITISGQLPLAHGAFLGIGAYVAGMASRWLNWPCWVTIPVGGLTAMAVGIGMSYPFSRLRALYYAMGSLFFGIAVMLIISAGGVWTGSYAGLSGIHEMFVSKEAYYYFYFGLAVVSIALLYRFEFCRLGTTLKAIAQSHAVASSVGINEARYRILAVAVGCFFVGLSGAAYVHYQLILNVSSYSLSVTLWLFMYVLVGGIDSFAGPIIGTCVLILIPQYFLDLKTYSPYISAGLVLVVAYLMPKGLMGIPAAVRSWSADRKEKRESD